MTHLSFFPWKKKKICLTHAHTRAHVSQQTLHSLSWILNKGLEIIFNFFTTEPVVDRLRLLIGKQRRVDLEIGIDSGSFLLDLSRPI